MMRKLTLDSATQIVQSNIDRLSNDSKLRFYGLYKQASKGDCNEDPPSRFSIVQYAKWNAWKKVAGMSSAEAQDEYFRLASELSQNEQVSKSKPRPSTAQAKDSEIMLRTLEHGGGSIGVVFAFLVCGAIAVFGVGGFLLSVLSHAALQFLLIFFVGIFGMWKCFISYYRQAGLLSLFSPWVQRALLESTMLDFILDRTLLQEWLDWLAEIGPVFHCKTPQDRVAALQFMSERTRRLMTTRGLVNLLSPAWQKCLLSTEQITLQKKRLEDESIAYSPSIQNGSDGVKWERRDKPDLERQRRLTSLFLKKRVLDSLADQFVGIVNPKLCSGISLVFGIALIGQLRMSPNARLRAIIFLKHFALQTAFFGSSFFAIVAVVYHAAMKYKLDRRRDLVDSQ